MSVVQGISGDRQTDTHRPSTVTLAVHVCRGLKMHE